MLGGSVFDGNSFEGDSFEGNSDDRYERRLVAAGAFIG